MLPPPAASASASAPAPASASASAQAQAPAPAPASAPARATTPKVTDHLMAGQAHPVGWSLSAMSPSTPDSPPPAIQVPKLTFTNGLALVLGLQIGSGIFSSPAVVCTHVPNALAGILVWIAAGLLVWTGAATFCELGLTLPGPPRNGGIQQYLRECYGGLASCTFCAVWVLCAKPAANAMAAMIFAEHSVRALAGGHGNVAGTGRLDETTVGMAIALACICAVTLLNCGGAHAGARAANVFLVIKLVAILSIGFIGLAVGLGMPRVQLQQLGREHIARVKAEEEEEEMGFASYVTALFGALFAFGGWETIGFVTGELENPRRLLPRITNSGMSMVIICFALANTALYIVLPMDVLGRTNTVAVEFGTAVFGTPGAVVYSVLVAISCLGALNSSVFSTGRLTCEAAKSRYFPAVLRLHNDSHIPAMLFNAAVSCCYVLFGTFRGLVTFKGVVEYALYTLTASGVFVLRRRHARDNEAGPPNPHGPRRTYTANPILFCGVGAVLVTRAVVSQPWIGLGLVVVMATGRVWYGWSKL